MKIFSSKHLKTGAIALLSLGLGSTVYQNNQITEHLQISQAQITTFETENSQLQAQLTELKTKSQSLETALKSVEQEHEKSLENLKKQLNDKEKAHQELAKKYNELELKNTETEKKKQALEAKQAEIEQKSKELETQKIEAERLAQEQVTTAQPQQQSVVAPVQQSAYYTNCSAARAAGAAPVRIGDPGYGRHLDRDGDGVGCE